jgi:hypothetical protein
LVKGGPARDEGEPVGRFAGEGIVLPPEGERVGLARVGVEAEQIVLHVIEDGGPHDPEGALVAGGLLQRHHAREGLVVGDHESREERGREDQLDERESALSRPLHHSSFSGGR